MYYSETYFRRIAPLIRMPEDMLSFLLSFMPALPEEEGEALARYITSPNVPITDKREKIQALATRENGSLLAVLVYMAAAGYTHEAYRRLSLPDSVFYDSLNCLPEKLETNMRHHGTWDYPPITWPLGHVNLTIFRIGRLGYQRALGLENENISYNGMTVAREGKPVLHIHISDNEKLVGITESLESARAFFRRYFPADVPPAFLCTTWLLDPKLGALLPENSNIRHFQSHFTIYDRYDDTAEVLKRTFGFADENPNVYTPKTSLEKKVVTYLKDGGKLGRGRGFILF